MPEDQKTTARTDRILNASHDRPSLMQERRLKPHGDQIFKCPRCDSLNTKFCYYNNYSLSQPRHFCKSCKRYWTKGGALRNVPIGGGCRKNKSIKQRTAVDQCFPSSSSLTAEDQAIMRGGDGSSSSSPLQHEFSGSAPSPELYACSSPGLYGTDGQEGLGLAFERLDQTRAFSVNNAPIPVQWAPAQELLPTTPPSENSLNSFDSSILALTLTGHLNQNTKRLQNGELSSLLAAPPPSSLNDHNLAAPYNFCSLQSFGLPSSNGDLLQWRLPPRLLTLAEDNGRKGKLLSTEIDQTSSPADWRPPSDGFFELAMGDTGSDWSSHSWLPDMAMYGSMAGSQPL